MEGEMLTLQEWRAQCGQPVELVMIAERVGATGRGRPNHSEMRKLVSAGLAEIVTDTWSACYVLTEEGRRVAHGHRKMVADALRAGEDVPTEILRCYPGMVEVIRR
jgi:hypothetical protein